MFFLRFFFLMFFLQGCFSEKALYIGQGSSSIYALPMTKEKQRMALLQKKLEKAQQGLGKAQEEVERLGSDLYQSQLAFIEKQIENYELQICNIRSDPNLQSGQGSSKEASSLFVEERELLQKMMENGSSPTASAAQMILDRILRMITEIGSVP